MPDNEPVFDIAVEIHAWQEAALRLPLPRVQEIACDSIEHLGCLLNTFNQVFLAQHDGEASTEALEHAVMQVARQATGAAIFTLAVANRTREAAALN